MRKPMIGIVPLMDIERESYWMLPGYMEGIRQAGGVPVMLPLTSDEEELGQIVDTFDGFLFTGGQDVSPSVYGEPESPQCGQCCPGRDAMEAPLLRLVMAADKAVFGICRGMQLINAVLGGTLYQDLPTDYPSEISHRQSAPYDVPSHPVILAPDSPLYRLLKADTYEVNSCHHQAVRNLAPGLVSMAKAPDGLVEAVYAPAHSFLWAVQWHPEFAYRSDAASQAILGAFVEGCRRELR